ncbi:MAG TPA: transglutaminase family protein [Candidatus Thermoplasmatota archaeon]|jgi:transglutaminase-like putative cysteine protease|nr:transglutaminase family protein [Candidatus Thermoplasmatota archaeon]
MLIDVEHLTRYTYSAPVTLDRQLVRLKPRSDAYQQLKRFELKLQPASARSWEETDAEGNAVMHVQVHEPVTLFEVVSRALVETRAPAPLPDEAPAAALRFPLHYPADTPPAVLAYAGPVTTDPAVNRFAAEVADGARWEVLPFLALLAARIQRTHAYQLRYEGPPRPAAATLERREGACRDFAVLYIDACRAFGVASRFVSGYRLRDPDGVGRELHAWVEAYVPGVGWRGFDPTSGRPVADDHVAIAAGTPATAAPVTGTFWGSGVSSQLLATVEARRAQPEMLGAA